MNKFNLYPFPKGQISDSSKLKAFADDNFNFDENGLKFSKWAEITVGKGEIARYEQFLLFPQCFKKTCTAKTRACLGKGQPFCPNKPWFLLQYKSFENSAGKGEIAHNEQFLLFPQCFLPVPRTFSHCHQTYNCRLQTLLVWNSLKFVVWERVKIDL